MTDFLTRAHEKDYAVPAQALRLARNRRAAAGDLRYYADTRLAEFETPIARAQLAAALALYGDAEWAKRAFASAYRLGRADPDGAALASRTMAHRCAMTRRWSRWRVKAGR